MQVIRLSLRNWCQHEDRELLLSPHLNAFLGANGSGKSNAVKAIPYALTGAVFGGPKDANISQLVKEGVEQSSSFVELEFRHGTTRAVLKRVLKGGQSSLLLYDALGAKLEDVRGDKKVTARVLALLDTTESILNDYVFVGQEELFAPFSAATRPADRAVAFQKLFGISRAEEIWSAVGVCLSTTPEIVAPDVQQLTNEVATGREALAKLDQEIAAIGLPPDWSEAADPDVQLAFRYREAESARTTLTTLQPQYEAASKTYDENVAILEHTRGDCAIWERSLTQAQQSLAAADAVLGQRATFQDWQGRLAGLQAEETAKQQAYETCANAVVTLLPVAEWPEWANLPEADVQKQRDDVSAKLSADKLFTDNFANGRKECPICRRVSDADLTALLKLAQESVAYNTTRLARMDACLGTLRENGRRMLVWTTNRDTAWKAWETAKQARASFMAGVVPVDADEPAVVAANTLYSNMASWQTLQQQDAAKVRTYEGICQQQRLQLEQLRTSVLQTNGKLLSAPTKEQYDVATQAVNDKRKKATDLAVLQSRRAQQQDNLTQSEDRLRKGQELAESSRRSREIRTRLAGIREVMHRDNLPGAVSQRYLEELAHKTNEILSLFSAGFRIQPEDGLSYRANFFDGRVQPLIRLSGGERVITALAFRIATNARFAKDLGMLCLDEPTAGLDKDNLGCLDLALGKLRELSQSRSLQCILITHENVGHLFDHVESFNVND